MWERGIRILHDPSLSSSLQVANARGGFRQGIKIFREEFSCPRSDFGESAWEKPIMGREGVCLLLFPSPFARKWSKKEEEEEEWTGVRDQDEYNERRELEKGADVLLLSPFLFSVSRFRVSPFPPSSLFLRLVKEFSSSAMC